jgi:tetratricopeptide (TPR) repeat protein
MKTAGAILLLSLLSTSCKDFLEENPKDRQTTTNFYTTEENALSAVSAVYAHLNSQSGDTFGGVYFGGFWVTEGLSSDEMINLQSGSPDQDQLATFTQDPNNATLYEIWKQHYKAISLANVAIAKIPGIQMDETVRTRYVNEAKFLRGLLYFNLVRMFGKIPLLTSDVTSTTPAAAEVDAIYTQILADLNDATNLPADQADGRGRATAGAAHALLAKVYLTRKDYDNTIAECEKVINSGKYELWDNFADIFKIANRGLKEAIFSVGFGTAGNALSFWEVAQVHVRLLPPELSSAGITSNTLGWTAPTQALVDSYDAIDERRDVTVFNRFSETVSGKAYNVPFSRYYFRKYWDVTTPTEFNTTEANIDFPVIRYADVLLMYAEALNEKDRSQEAHDAVNLVRNRANLADLSGLSKDAFRDAVLVERRHELAAEGHRWFDLARTGKLEQLVPLAKPGVTPQAKHYLFPIPQRERDLDPNLPQNDY